MWSDDSSRLNSLPPPPTSLLHAAAADDSVVSSGPRNDPVLSDLGIDRFVRYEDFSASSDC